MLLRKLKAEQKMLALITIYISISSSLSPGRKICAWPYKSNKMEKAKPVK
jgi:hypothetical protein